MAGEGSPRKEASLQEALKYVSTAWIPPNPDVVRFVTEEFKRGRYESDRGALIRDLKRDFSLYGYTYKKLGTLTGREGKSSHPNELLQALPKSELTALLDDIQKQLSTHSSDRKQDFQAKQFRHSAVSTATTELVAARSDTNADSAFSAAFLRQIGFMLVAWNYPRTFQKALAAAKNVDNNLERTLTNYLGFSPTLLGIQATVAWNENPALFIGIDYASLSGADLTKLHLYKLDDESRFEGESIAALCELGESFSRATDPDTYSTSPKEWDRVNQKLNHHLGSEALSIIANHLGKSVSHYADSKEGFVLSKAPQRASGKGMSPYAKRLMEENSQIRRLSPDLQKLFKRIYEEVDEHEVSLDGMNILITEVIPIAGFSRGCIYMQDDKHNRVVPRLRIGTDDISRYQLRTTSFGDAQSHPVLQALSCHVPIKQEQVPLFGELVSHITSYFGNREKTGVLYLEMGPEFERKDAAEQLNVFKAVRQALNDVLRLRGI